MTFKFVARILWETFQWVAMLGGVLGLITGIALIFNSALVMRISARMNVWISTRQAMRPFEEPIEIERAVYRSHRMIGALLLVGALFTLYVIGLRFKGPELGFVMTKFVRAEVAAWIGHSLRAFLIVVNIGALAIAATMLIRPSALKRVEAWANASFSGRQATRTWEIPRVSVDRLVERHPRLMGTALTLASLYLALALVYERFLHRH